MTPSILRETFTFRGGKNFLLSLLLLITAFGSSAFASSSASVNVLHNAKATSVISLDYTTTSQGTYTFETRITSQTGDTVLHLMKQNSSGEWTQVDANDKNDDCGVGVNTQDCSVVGNGNVVPDTGNNPHFRSKLVLSLDANTKYRLIVRSYSVISTNPGSTTTNFVVTDEGLSAGMTEVWATDTNNQTQNLIPGPVPGSARFAGTTMLSSLMGTSSGQLIYETARNPETPEDVYPEMYLIECGTQKIIKSSTWFGNGFTGVGPNSRLSAPNVCGVLLGTINTVLYSAHLVGTEGYVNVYINDANLPGHDQDNDGLGYQLEQTLGSCDRRIDDTGQPIPVCGDTVVVPMTGGFVNKVFNLNDSDGDGLPDGLEVFGREIGDKQTGIDYDYLELQKMGASPTTKDLFFEVDYSNDLPENPLRETELLIIKAFFEDVDPAIIGPQLGVFPNSSPIRLHFDIGQEPAPPQNPPSFGRPSQYYLHSLFGDWGGSSTFPTPTTPAQITEAEHGPTSGPNATGILANVMAPIRKGIFRHIALFTRFNVGGGFCSGDAGISDHVDTGFGGGVSTMRNNACLRVLTHEIGHMVGIGHHGTTFWGGVINGNAMYRSIMNYAYSDNRNVGFFSNSPTTVPKINTSYTGTILDYDPSQFSLTTPIYQNLDFSTLSGILFRAPPVALSPPSTQQPQYAVNWSRTNHSLGDIRWPVHLVDNSEISKFSDFGTHGALSIRTSAEITSTKLTKYNVAGTGNVPRMYAFYVNQGKIFYKHGDYTPTPDATRSSCLGSGLGGAMNGRSRYTTHDAAGNFTNHNGRCTDWSSNEFLVLTGETNITSVSALEVKEINNTTHNLILLFYTTSDNKLLVLPSSSINNTSTSTTTPALQAGEIGWGSAVLIASNADGTPEPIELNNSISVFFKDTTDTYRKGTLTHDPNPSNWTWSVHSVLDSSNNQSIQGKISPSLVWWPDKNHPNAKLCAIFTELETNRTDEKMRFFCRNSQNSTWDDLSSIAFGEGPYPRTEEKPSIIYRKQRKTGGTEISLGGLAPGHFWLYHVSTSRNANFLVSRELDTNQHSITNFDQNSPMFEVGRVHTLVPGITLGTTYSVLNDPEIATVKALVITDTTTAAVNLRDLPFADGAFKAEIKLDSDFKLMDSRICRGIASSLCADMFNTRWGY